MSCRVSLESLGKGVRQILDNPPGTSMHHNQPRRNEQRLFHIMSDEKNCLASLLPDLLQVNL